MNNIKKALWSPLTHTLGGAALGAGAGFAWDAIEKWLKDEKSDEPISYFRPITLGILGALPGIGHGLSQSYGMRGPKEERMQTGWFSPTPHKVEYYPTDVPWHHAWTRSSHDLAKESPFFKQWLDKKSEFQAQNQTWINTDRFGRAIWEDPHTNFQNAYAVTNLLDNTAQQNNSMFVSPVQIAGNLINAGIGSATGWAIGKTLGGLAGISPGAQQTIQNVGMWGGLMNGIGNQIR